MITEDYVSFETAKLLKERGFDGECDLFGRTDEAELIIREAAKIAYNQGIDDECVILPTIQMAMKWLREVHHVACFICPSIEQGFHTNKWNSYIDKLSDNFPKDPLWFVETSDSYEQACEAAIKYCLDN